MMNLECEKLKNNVLNYKVHVINDIIYFLKYEFNGESIFCPSVNLAHSLKPISPVQMPPFSNTASPTRRAAASPWGHGARRGRTVPPPLRPPLTPPPPRASPPPQSTLLQRRASNTLSYSPSPESLVTLLPSPSIVWDGPSPKPPPLGSPPHQR
jgi:hypothetical protein